MQNNNSKSILILLGERIKAYRIEYPMTQKELADKSGVSVRSIQNFEHGADIQLSNLVKIMKALELGDNISMLVPDVSKRPSVFFGEDKEKERVRKAAKPTEVSFKWGDEE